MLTGHTSSGAVVETRRPRATVLKVTDARRRAEAAFKARPKTAANDEPSQVLQTFSGDWPSTSYRRAQSVQMTISEWDAIPRNPRQRNEIVRIEKNRIDHLLNPNEKHREVAMGGLPVGRQYKVDGHTRSAAWRLGLVDAPSYLIVDVYLCADMDAVEDLYDQFDSSAATESGTDRVTGAYAEAGVSPESAMLREGGISTAARALYHYLMHTSPDRKTKNMAINRCVKMFAPEIMLLDSIPPSRYVFPTGVLMGALLTFATAPEDAHKFWSAYAADAGWKGEGRVDAVEALRARHAKLRGKSNGARDSALMNYSIAAFRGYQKGSTYSVDNLIKEMSKDLLRRYAADVLAKKGAM